MFFVNGLANALEPPVELPPIEAAGRAGPNSKFFRA
jgi:hypothetical protein